MYFEVACHRLKGVGKCLVGFSSKGMNRKRTEDKFDFEFKLSSRKSIFISGHRIN